MAHAEFSFIDKSFYPTGGADVNEHEGGIQDKAGITETVLKDRPNGISVHIPITMSESESTGWNAVLSTTHQRAQYPH